jgi:cysteine synthase A
MKTAAPLDPRTAEAFRALARTVGNSPLLAITLRFRGALRTLYAKSEQLNMTGSIKDRMALHVLRRAYEIGAIRAGDTIVEATSGNTGISFAALGRALGHPVTIFMPDWLSRERTDLLRSFDARIELVSREQGGFVGCIDRAEALAARDPRVFLPRQFSNPANVEAHALTTGPEIVWQLGHRGLAPDAFVAGVGTGGTVMGVGRHLRAVRPGVRVHPLEPKESPTLSTGCKLGSHRIQGVSDEFVPAILELAALDAVVGVNDGDAILMSQMLAARLGLGVGISSGANLIGALMVQQALGPDAIVVTVFPDDNKKYLSPGIELLGLDALPRTCEACVDLGDGPRARIGAGSRTAPS